MQSPPTRRRKASPQVSAFLLVAAVLSVFLRVMSPILLFSLPSSVTE